MKKVYLYLKFYVIFTVCTVLTLAAVTLNDKYIHNLNDNLSHAYNMNEILLLKTKDIMDENKNLQERIINLQHKHKIEIKSEDLEWLTKVIYFESRSESVLGKIAVGFVIMNRLNDDRFPDNIKSIIIQKNQFEWYWDGKPDIMNNSIAKEQCEEVARSILLKDIKYDPTEGATHFINVNTKKAPLWTRLYTKVTRIDNHIFYRWD